MRKSLCSEASEQTIVANKLDAARVRYFAVPNGGTRPKLEAIAMVKAGVKSGVPDLVIIDRPPCNPEAPGAVIEMKRLDGGVTSDNQIEWLAAFHDRGWLTAVCAGGWQAVDQLRKWGYLKPYE